MQIQALHRFAGGRKVKGIERGRWLWFYQDEDDLDLNNEETTTDEFKPYRKNLRFVDIVLEESDGRETWVELKSLQAASAQKREELLPSSWPINPWIFANLGKAEKKSNYNRQYLLDQTAGKVKHARITKAETKRLTGEDDENAPVDVSNNYQWRFQKFKVKNPITNQFIYSPRLGNTSDENSIRYRISQAPEGISGGDAKEAYDTNTKASSITGNSHIVFADVKDLLNQLKEAGFEMAEEALAAELEVDD